MQVTETVLSDLIFETDLLAQGIYKKRTWDFRNSWIQGPLLRTLVLSVFGPHCFISGSLLSNRRSPGGTRWPLLPQDFRLRKVPSSLASVLICERTGLEPGQRSNVHPIHQAWRLFPG